MLPAQLDTMNQMNRNPLFRLIGEDGLQELAAQTRTASIRGGQIIFDRGDSCNGFFLILSGSVILERETGKGEETIAVLGPGDHFGSEMLSDSTRIRLTRATALTETSLVKFSRKDLRELFSGNSQFEQAAHLEHKSYLYGVKQATFPGGMTGKISSS